MKYDFAGWATKNDMLCSDGRVIHKDAFKEDSGKRVPLVWMHDHKDPSNVLGHALLENREEGVYAYCAFNDTPRGKDAKEMVSHGDVDSLSIFATRLKQQSNYVMHGNIREVSLVLTGANPGAKIESVILQHGDGDYEETDEAIITTGESFELYHSEEKTEEKSEEKSEDKKEVTVKEVYDSLNDTQKKCLHAMIGMILTNDDEDEDDDDDDDDEDEELEHSDLPKGSIGEVFNTFTEEQKIMAEIFITLAIADAGKKLKHSEDMEDDISMKKNVFDGAEPETMETLSHSEMVAIFEEAKNNGQSLKSTILAHGIDDIDYLFPDAKSLNNPPEFIKRDTAWASEFLGLVRRTPFSRIKSQFANITADDARARGYIKGNQKVEETFGLLKRTTTPQTIYKKQKLDRDDILDITDFDVVSWLKWEMRYMLNEEIARAALIGDGRASSSDDKINETMIRPIYNDADLYTIKTSFTLASTASDNDKARAFIRAAVKARKNYRGTGNPILYTTEDMITDMLLLEDSTGRYIYEDMDKLARTLRVRKIVGVPVMESITGANGGTLEGIVVNPVDYTIGADKGGAVSMFEDFDIDYNQQKYLIETRCSGALTVPYSAIAIESTVSDG